MRKIKWISLLFFLLVACKKNSSNNTTTTVQNTKTIVGQWTWFKSSSSLTTVTPQSSGHLWALKFNSDSSCVQTGDFYPGGTGTYSLGYTVASLASGTSFKITLALYNQNYIYSIKSADTLELYDPAAPPVIDGFTYFFVRR